ncbi:MAG: DUF11 domain-containing protein [Anaerolineae bacterium]|nr:DUF11 domain-containing protein [Anaerolineae bacterium]
MTKQLRLLLYILFLIITLAPLAFFVLLDVAQGEGEPTSLVVSGLGQRYTENIAVIDIRNFGYQPAQIPPSTPSSLQQVQGRHFIIHNSSLPHVGGSNPNNPYAVIRKTAATFLHPGVTAYYEISLANYESVTHTYRLTDTLPPQLTYVPDSTSDLTYNPTTRTLTWQGELSPGHLDYVIEENSLMLPYLDLADFGAVNLCDDFIANGEDCNDVTVTFNLGVNGYTTNMYGEVLNQLTLSSNGLILGNDMGIPNPHGHNQWLPDAAAPGFVLAGLWRDVDLTNSGRWHTAIISGLVQGHDVFYAQWHDAPHAHNPDLTARHAIAVLLNGGGSMAGHAFFIYDNISNPAQTVAGGYTIGVEDKLGVRGVTYAYAPCCGDPQPPQGYPPAAGTTVHLWPVLFGATNDYGRTFSYEALVNGSVPETITNTAVAVYRQPAGADQFRLWPHRFHRKPGPPHRSQLLGGGNGHPCAHRDRLPGHIHASLRRHTHSGAHHHHAGMDDSDGHPHPAAAHDDAIWFHRDTLLGDNDSHLPDGDTAATGHDHAWFTHDWLHHAGAARNPLLSRRYVLHEQRCVRRWPQWSGFPHHRPRDTAQP